jgi:hypothetical protein
MCTEKPKHTMFLPESVLAELLECNYPSWKRDTQRESVEWVMASMKNFFGAPNPWLGIHSTDECVVHQREMDDSGHVALWACNVLQSKLKESPNTSAIFKDACIPVLRAVAFRGADKDLEKFLKSLEWEFAQVLATIDLSEQWSRYDAVHHIHQFEKTNLARSARTTAARVLTKHSILFGGMVYASAFALAALRLQWMERRTKLMMDVGVIPIFR